MDAPPDARVNVEEAAQEDAPIVVKGVGDAVLDANQVVKIRALPHAEMGVEITVQVGVRIHVQQDVLVSVNLGVEEIALEGVQEIAQDRVASLALQIAIQDVHDPVLLHVHLLAQEIVLDSVMEQQCLEGNTNKGEIET